MLIPFCLRKPGTDLFHKLIRHSVCIYIVSR
jgi:hypothetical protein